MEGEPGREAGGAVDACGTAGADGAGGAEGAGGTAEAGGDGGVSAGGWAIAYSGAAITAPPIKSAAARRASSKEDPDSLCGDRIEEYSRTAGSSAISNLMRSDLRMRRAPRSRPGQRR